MVDSDTFRQITDTLAEVIWLVDPGFEEVLYMNPAYEDLVGRPVEVATDRLRNLDNLHPDDRDRFADWITTIREDVEAEALESEYAIEVRVQRPDGEVRWVETVAVPIRNADGSLAGIAGITTDNTERVERERELEATVERLDEFASMLSHDLRNPITVARGRYELYRETGEESHLDAVGTALERIEDLTMDLTTLARHGAPADEHEPVDLETTAKAAWDAIDTRDATLETTPVTIDGDPGQLQALFENLFRNAVGHGGPDVTVRVDPVDGGFYVEDTGSGIPESEREQVFEHGFTTGYSGSGVGLTIVGRIADAHGFDVSLGESAAGGARFDFIAS